MVGKSLAVLCISVAFSQSKIFLPVKGLTCKGRIRVNSYNQSQKARQVRVI